MRFCLCCYVLSLCRCTVKQMHQKTSTRSSSSNNEVPSVVIFATHYDDVLRFGLLGGSRGDSGRRRGDGGNQLASRTDGDIITVYDRRTGQSGAQLSLRSSAYRGINHTRRAPRSGLGATSKTRQRDTEAHHQRGIVAIFGGSSYRSGVAAALVASL